MVTETISQPPRSLLEKQNISVKSAMRQKINVMHAVILRDIRSRYFNHGLGFLIVPLFPASHLGLLLLVYSITGRNPEFGDDARLFFATGLLPALTFSYVSRFMSISLLMNKSMMAFPVVKLLDIVLARAFLEFIGILIAALIIVLVVVIFGSNPIPREPSEAVLAFTFTVMVALGYGIIASVITSIFPSFSMFYALSMFVFYVASGAPIYLHSFPDVALYWCSWNPVFHSVEWMRSAYYLGYSTQYLDKTYLIANALGSVAIGLFMERTLRKSVLED
ncbi:ABC transporter permease [Agrobacterium vitis]|uniref:ABC transporter permease n=1 Tax=Agrobacterium vitis TaxID=373 RepID=UPI003D2DB944